MEAVCEKLEKHTFNIHIMVRNEKLSFSYPDRCPAEQKPEDSGYQIEQL